MNEINRGIQKRMKQNKIDTPVIQHTVLYLIGTNLHNKNTHIINLHNETHLSLIYTMKRHLSLIYTMKTHLSLIYTMITHILSIYTT